MTRAPEPVTMEMTRFEMLLISQVGCAWYLQNQRLNRVENYGKTEDDWTTKIEAAGAEAAVAKFLGRWWNGHVGDLRATDAGPIVQVRQTALHRGRLILHPFINDRGDRDEHAFVLVTGIGPTYTLRGWTMGFAGKQQHYWGDPGTGRPAFWVPQRDLHDVRELKERLHDTMGQAGTAQA